MKKLLEMTPSGRRVWFDSPNRFDDFNLYQMSDNESVDGGILEIWILLLEIDSPGSSVEIL